MWKVHKTESTIVLNSEKDRATVTGNMYRKFSEIWTCVFRYASGQTDNQTYRQADRNISPTYRGWGEVMITVTIP